MKNRETSSDIDADIYNLRDRIDYLEEKNTSNEDRIRKLEKYIATTSKMIVIEMPQEYKYSRPIYEKDLDMSLSTIETCPESGKNALKKDRPIIRSDEKVSLFQFFRRMILIAYACYRYPWGGDIFIDFKTGTISKSNSSRSN